MFSARFSYGQSGGRRGCGCFQPEKMQEKVILKVMSNPTTLSQKEFSPDKKGKWRVGRLQSQESLLVGMR